MNQKDLCSKIGIADRSFRRLSPTKRKQWQSLAAKGRTIAWFDVLAQLMFEVDSYNATTDTCGIKLDLCKSMVTVHQFDCDANCVKSFWINNIEELTSALQYVQGLNK